MNSSHVRLRCRPFIHLLYVLFISTTTANQISLESAIQNAETTPSGNQIQEEDYFSALRKLDVGPFSGHLQHWSLQTFSATTPPFTLNEEKSEIKPRTRKSMGALSQLYTGLWNRQKARARKLYEQRYSTRSDTSHQQNFPPSTSAEYFISEFRRLFSTQATPRRPYAMRLRWG